MRKKEDRQVLTASVAEAASEAEQFVTACKEAIFSEIRGLIDQLFRKLDNTLSDLADKSEGSDPDAAYLFAMRVFQSRRGEIRYLFLASLLENGDDEPGSPPTTDTRSVRCSYGFGLRDEVELEENLAIANLISKAENRYHSELVALRRHLASLGWGQGIDSRTDPLGPQGICTAFQRALRPAANVELAIKLVVYKLFDKQVMDQLGDVYRRCCQSAGHRTPAPKPYPRLVEPLVSGEVGGADRDQVQAKAPSLNPREESIPGWKAIEKDRTVTFHDLQRLLGRHRPRGPGVSTQVVDMAELMSALSGLQQTARAQASPESLRRRLGEHLVLGLEDPSDRVFGRAEEDTLDLICLLFQHLLEGNQIPDPFQTLIRQLEIPILKVALADKSFFEDKRHPARRLLNHLTQAAIGWNDDGDRSLTSLYGHINRVLDRAVRCNDWDPTLIAELDAELCDLLVPEWGVAQPHDVEAQQDRDLHERRQSALHLVKEAIDKRLQDRGPVPQTLSSLLYEGWQQVLLAAYLREGTEGAGWKMALETIDRLLWSVQPKRAYEDRRELLRSIPELLGSLRQSLSEVCYDQRRLARWLKELQALHIIALRGARPEPADGSPRARPADDPMDQPRVASLNSKDTPNRSGATATTSQVSGLKSGSWIEVRRDDDRLIRAKLAWRSPQSGIHLFVDRGGRKVLELTAEDLLDLEQQGTLTVLGGTPIVDRAIQQLVKTLRGDQET